MLFITNREIEWYKEWNSLGGNREAIRFNLKNNKPLLDLTYGDKKDNEFMFSSGFMQLLGIASILAVSLTYYFFQEFFLSNFANKTSLGIMDFGLGVILMFIIGGLIIGSQTWIAARTRPSLTLKDE